MKRGEVWWATLPEPSGSGPGFRRPVLIVQSNAFNESRVATVVVAMLTSNLALAAAPGNVRVGKRETGLPKASVVNVSQVLTVDKSVLQKHVRALPSETFARIEEGLRLVLGL